MTPKLTIAIPTLNRCQLLKRAVESALGQTASDIEILVSNNGSTDETREILSRFNDPRLRIVHRDQTIDACSHGNYLVAAASGELFLGLSDDDYLEPGFAAAVIALFESHPEISFAYTGCNIYYADVAIPARTGPTIEPGSEFLYQFISGKRDICWCACVTRTADLRTIGDIPVGTICGDMFYWTKLAARSPVGCIERTLSHYIAFRPNGDNCSTGSYVVEWAKEITALTDFMVATCVRSDKQPTPAGTIMRAGREFASRSTAGQFVWNALRGHRRPALISAAWRCIPYMRGAQAGMWLRIMAAILLPRRILQALVLSAASTRADRARQAHASDR